MRILEHDGPTSTQLQYHPQSKHLPFCVVNIDSQTPTLWCDTIELGFKRFDEAVKNTTTKAKPTLDLEHPPEGLQTSKGDTVRVLGKLDNYGDFPYVIAIHDGKQEHTYLANRSGKVNTLETSRKQLTTGPVKKEGWVNLYRHPSRLAKTGCVYKTRDEAILAASSFARIATVKITWEK